MNAYEYVKKCWPNLVWLHEEMVGEIKLSTVKCKNPAYFYVCSVVIRKEQKFIRLNNERRKESNNYVMDVNTIDLDEAISGLKGVLKEVAELFMLGYSNNDIKKRLNIDSRKLNKLKERLRNDRKFAEKIRPC